MKRVAVLLGGRSAERNVSLVSGRACAQAGADGRGQHEGCGEQAPFHHCDGFHVDSPWRERTDAGK